MKRLFQFAWSGRISYVLKPFVKNEKVVSIFDLRGLVIQKPLKNVSNLKRFLRFGSSRFRIKTIR